jgi:hypothetical protein
MEHSASDTWLGSTVLYANRDGRIMPAIVCGTEATADCPADPGTLHLTVLSPRSGPYVKHSVPRAPEGASEIAPHTYLPSA